MEILNHVKLPLVSAVETCHGVYHGALETAQCFGDLVRPLSDARVWAGIGIVAGCGVLTAVVWRNSREFRRDVVDGLTTQALNFCAGPVLPDYRQLFKDDETLLTVRHGAPRNHSHPQAAKFRCLANTAMHHFVRRVGKQVYCLSMSKSERQAGKRGVRNYYHAKDLQMRPVSDTLDGIIVMTDVDYYVNMERVLNGQYVLLYTFVPRRAAGKTDDGVYTWNADQTVTTVVNGGARYQHELWHYDEDHFVVDHWWGSSVYLVEQVRVTDDRRIILLNPVRNVYGPLGWFVRGARLHRRQPVRHGVIVERYTETTNEGVQSFVSMARCGEFVSAKFSEAAFVSAVTRAQQAKSPHLSDIERICNAFQVDDGLVSATIFLDVFMRNSNLLTNLPSVMTPCVDQHSYQALHPLITEDGTPSMRALWPGYYRSAFAPVKSLNNDTACLEGRIDEPKNLRPSIPPIYYTWFQEFVEALVPSSVVHTLGPQDFDYMYDKFDRPSQRTMIEQNQHCFVGKAVVRSFQKAEAYGKITAPRNISTLPIGHNFVLGQFMYPFMDHVLKKVHWYAFGKHPKTSSGVLTSKAFGTRYAVETDANKLDGSIRGFFRDLLVAAFTRAFQERYTMELMRLELKERYVNARTSHGLQYQTDSTILSGSVITSVLGSLTNAFINYAALRHIWGPTQAWERLGMYGGDDGVTFDLPAALLKKTAATLGLAFDAEEIPAGNPVNFLGRIYPDVWTSGQSIADVKRQMRKLHLTAAPDIVPRDVVLHRKARGYLATDARTPLLTVWAQAVIRLTDGADEHKYYHLAKCDDRYLVGMGGNVYESPTDVQYTYGLVARLLELTVVELCTIEAKMRNAKTMDELLSDMNLPDKVDVQIPAVQAGRIVKPDKYRQRIPDKVRQNAELRPPRLCKYGAACKIKRCTFVHGPEVNQESRR